MTNLAQWRSRLATEVMGYVVNSDRYRIGDVYELDGIAKYVTSDYRPDEDVAQAIRLLEAYRYGGICEFVLVKSETETTSGWYCSLQFEDCTFEANNKSLSVAIVTAVVRALGWEEEA